MVDLMNTDKKPQAESTASDVFAPAEKPIWERYSFTPTEAEQPTTGYLLRLSCTSDAVDR